LDRGLGLLKEARQGHDIKRPAVMLTWFFQKIAKEYG
jgi:hypothetical protein